MRTVMEVVGLAVGATLAGIVGLAFIALYIGLLFGIPVGIVVLAIKYLMN